MFRWWIAGLILHRHDLSWLIPFLLYLAITLRIIFLYVPITVVTTPMRWVWEKTATPIVRIIPQKWRTPASALLVIAVILIGAFASPESADNTRANRAVSLVGLVLLITILYFTSKDRKRVDWHPVIVGMLVQFIIALFVLRTKAGYDIFNFISTLTIDLLDFAKDGVKFLTTTPSSIQHQFLVFGYHYPRHNLLRVFRSTIVLHGCVTVVLGKFCSVLLLEHASLRCRSSCGSCFSIHRSG
jgi:CNT family concentrative nucleoside transporter